MEQQRKKLLNVLDTENFGNPSRAYYLDIIKAKNQRPCLRITRRDQIENQLVKRNVIIFFEDDIAFLVEAMAMLLGRYSSGQLGASA